MSDLRDRGTLRGTLSVGSESGSTDNYNNLINKPSINSHELVGDQSGDDLGLINNDDLTFNVGYVSNNLHNIKYKNRTYTAYADPFRGATPNSNGTMGLVRAPLASQGDYDKFLKGNGTWANVGGYTELIPITAGYNTNSRVFTFDRIPKKISMQYTTGGWTFYRDIIWGTDRSYYQASQVKISDNANYTYRGVSGIVCDETAKSFTITGLNALQAANTDDVSGYMFVEY